MNDYAFKSGFIPKISDLECFSVLALSQEESE
jgi:hypothetical protein